MSTPLRLIEPDRGLCAPEIKLMRLVLPAPFGPITDRNSPGATVSLKITYQGSDVVVEEGSTVLIGSGETSQIQIARPGISRRHAAIAFDGATWKVEDANSRNGTFANGERVHVATIDGPTTLVLGHPTDGEAVTFTPIGDASADIQDEIDAFVID